MENSKEYKVDVYNNKRLTKIGEQISDEDNKG